MSAAVGVISRLGIAAGLVFLITLRGSGIRRRKGPFVSAPPAEPPSGSALPMFDQVRGVAARYAPIAAGATIILVAFVSRLRYVLAFDGTYGTGDAHLQLMRALHIMQGNVQPSPQLAVSSAVFDQPPLIPLTLAAVAKTTGASLEITPLILMPALTCAAVFALYRMLSNAFGARIAVAASLLVALLPRWSFDSTEPEKAPVVVSFVIFALAAMYRAEADRRYLPLAGFWLALAMLAHTTAYLFMPVLAVTWVIWHRHDLRRCIDRYALASLAMPLAAVAMYFAVARALEPAATSGATGSGSSTVLPAFVQTYVSAARSLVSGGFSDSAWQLYMDGIRHQLGMPILVLAIGGIALAVYETMFRDQRLYTPIVLWAVLITLAFALQYPASSHESRYPAYVTPVYVVFAVYFVARLGGLALLVTHRSIRWAGMGAAIGLTLYGGITYATAGNPGLRDLYASHEAAADYLTSNGLLDDGSAAVYMGWPSITFHILQERPDYEDRLIEFGFDSRPLEQFTPAFIEWHDVEYYIYTRTGNDYWNSGSVILDRLHDGYLLQEVATFTGELGSTTIYRLHARETTRAEDIAATYEQLVTESENRGLLFNRKLCSDQAGGLTGWEQNGTVALVPMEGCGVRVVNRAEWGGIRTFAAAAALQGPFTVIAKVEPVEQDPARSVVLALYAGYQMLGETAATLEGGHQYVLLEAYGPLEWQRLRLVLASGAGDAGDLVVHGIVMNNGLLADLLDARKANDGVTR